MQTQTYINIALIILAVAVITATLLQSQGGMGGLFGGDTMTGQYKTRRGLEKTLFQITIVLVVLFFSLVIVSAFLLSR
ncbi:MAG: preprotein translocase subunit SecG [Anaerolineae bacterium]|nr:preprotein translocase subunit SecG [Anaerolineae bacterium]